jgi:DnaJ-class molecular chaperone
MMDTNEKRKELLALTVRHDSMEWTTNEQFVLSDELVSFAREALDELAKANERVRKLGDGMRNAVHTLESMRTERDEALKQLRVEKLRALSAENIAGIALRDEINKALGKTCSTCNGTGEIECGCPGDLYDETTGLCTRCANTGKLKCLMCEVNSEDVALRHGVTRPILVSENFYRVFDIKVKDKADKPIVVSEAEGRRLRRAMEMKKKRTGNPKPK